MFRSYLQIFSTILLLLCVDELMGQSGHKMNHRSKKSEDFPVTLEGFGYHFNMAGQLRDIKLGIPFRFEVKPNDADFNQRHYEALGLVVDNHVYQLLEDKEKLERVEIPLDAVGDEPRSFIFTSRGYEIEDKILILIHGSGVVRAGQWSRSLIINHSLESGTQIPYIQRAKQDGYGVIVLNTNQNYGVLANKATVRGSEDPMQHFLYIWDKIIMRSAAKHIAIMAHSYGGCVVVNGLKQRPGEMMERVFAIAMSDSIHTLSSSKMASPAKQWFIKHAQNWVSSNLPLNAKIAYANPDNCELKSAGTKKHVETSWYVTESVFTYFKKKLEERIENVDKHLESEMEEQNDENCHIQSTEEPMSQNQESQVEARSENLSVDVLLSSPAQEGMKSPVEHDDTIVSFRRQDPPSHVDSEKPGLEKHKEDEF